MRCLTVGCDNTTREPNKSRCWKEFHMCIICAIEHGLITPKKGYNYSKKERKKLKVD